MKYLLSKNITAMDYEVFTTKDWFPQVSTQPFDEAIFIRESNLIDPQYDNLGRLIAGLEEGQPMYGNQKAALDIIPYLVSLNPIPKSLVLMLHRELTRDIEPFERIGQSGQYRNADVFIGGLKAPTPLIAQNIIRELLIPRINLARKQKLRGGEAWQFAWWCHQVFECSHPFIDGNGRCGRLLLNMVLDMLEHERAIIFFAKRDEYYRSIQQFRDEKFPSLLCTHKGLKG